MHVAFENHFSSWRARARQLLIQRVDPHSVVWIPQKEGVSSVELFSADDVEGGPSQVKFVVPATFLKLANDVAHHRDPNKWALMYRLAWRLCYENKNLMQISIDEDVRDFLTMQREIRIDVHKTHAFVRFRKLEREGQEYFLAWHQPRNPSLELSAPFFVKRFGSMQWSIYTSEQSVHWNLEELTFGDGVPQEAVLSVDGLESLWKTYYNNIFNPARIKLKTMKMHMPTDYWKSMPETADIPALLANSGARIESMFEQQKRLARATVPNCKNLSELGDALKNCRGCEIYKNATQSVMGTGPADAKIVFVGEQPGDEEDRSGKPFVGPAGELFSRALQELGVNRSEVYVTNAVKHFKWNIGNQGVRLHRRPTATEIGACKPWLDAELRLLKPEILICMGASAGQSVLGRLVAINDERGLCQSSSYCDRTMVTMHPSAILRQPDEQQKQNAWKEFLADMRKAIFREC